VETCVRRARLDDDECTHRARAGERRSVVVRALITS
jgi:hypothetical protein